MKNFLICTNGTWTEVKAGSPAQAVQKYAESINWEEDYIPTKGDVYEFYSPNREIFGTFMKNEKSKRVSSD